MFKSKRTLLVSLLVATAFFMEYLDSTALATALPTMARSFHCTLVETNVGMTSYLVALAIFLPVSGWIAGHFGSRKVFCTAIIGFVVFSILCSFCTNITEFIITRTFQGAFGAMMTPVGRLMVLRNTPKSELITAIAYITWPGLVAPIVGPPVGGFLCTFFTWHWIFYLNVPTGLLIFLLSRKIMPDIHDREKPKLDFDGLVTTAFALGSIMYSFDLLEKNDHIQWGLILLAVGILVFVFTFCHSRRKEHPLIDYSVLKIPTYNVTILNGSFSYMIIGCIPFLIPLMLQEGLGMSPLRAGSVFLAASTGNLMIKPATVWISHHFGFKNVLLANGFCFCLVIISCSFFTTTTPVYSIMALLFIQGILRSIQFSSLATLAFADVPVSQMSSANILFITMQQMSQGMGITLGSFILHLMQRLEGSRQPDLASFQDTLIVIGLLGIISMTGFFRLKHNAGYQVYQKSS